MKKVYLFSVLLLCTLFFKVNAGEHIKVLLVKDSGVLEKIANNQKLTQKDSTFFTILQDNKIAVEFPSNIFNHSAVSSHKIFIQFLDANENPITLAQANLSNIKIFNKPVTDINYNISYHVIELKTYLGNEPDNGQLIEIKVETNDGLKYNKWFRYINGWQPYNFLNNKIGIWFPVNMYSTNFDKSDNGVRFTAMPIGFAIGGKYNISQDFYLGISGTLNYTLTAAKDSIDANNSYLLQDFSVGPLIDLGGYAYIGYTYPVNLTSADAKLQPQFVIGVGIKITELLFGKK